MASYTEKVEAKVEKAKRVKKNRTVFKPEKPNKPTKPTPSTKPFKPTKPVKPNKPEEAKAEGKGVIREKGKLTFTRLRMLTTEINKLLAQTDPLKRGGESWNEFFKLAAPKVIAYLLWDMNEIKQTEVRSLVRYFSKRVKGTK